MSWRRAWIGVGEPLFGEDWWAEDQKLFEDAVARRTAHKQVRRGITRPAKTKNQPLSPAPPWIQGMLPWFEDPQGDEHESLRPDRDGSLGEVAPSPVRGDPEQGQLFPGLGEPGGVEDRRAGPGLRGQRPARRDVPGEGRPPGRSPAPRRADRPVRDDPPGPRTSSRRTLTQPAAFRPKTQDDLAPSGIVTRIRANLAALAILRTLQHDARPATPEEQSVLARWSGWGAVPEAFDETREEFAWARDQLTILLDETELAAARRNTLNAHYTDAALVSEIWQAAQTLGFTTGRVLEPGCGSGNFIGFAPPGAAMTGIELDPVTAALAQRLYPDARIQAESFADTRLPEASFDLAIGNVPFGQAVLHDRHHNRQGHSLHNFFIVKALHLTRPGGLVIVLTSRYTMDARNPAARREIATMADLVGAVRLPSGAHQRGAGTTVVTDLLILRRREPGRIPDPAPWEQARLTRIGDAELPVSEYFLANPHLILGTLDARHGIYNADDLVVRPTTDTTKAFREALTSICADADARGLTWTPAPEQTATPDTALATADRPEGHLTARPDGTFTRVTKGIERPHQVPRTQAAELRALLALRDTASELLDTEAATPDDTPDIEALRTKLNRQYDTYLTSYGPLNRYTVRRTGRTDPDTGGPVLARIQPPQGSFRLDPLAPVVYALEEFEPVGQRAAKAAIMRERVVAPRAARLGADTPADALAICLDTCGEVRLPEIARLLGVTEPEARACLGTLVFDDPGTGTLTPAAQYLSGNVREKLKTVLSVSTEDSRYAANVTALEEVIPADLGPAEIEARLGAAWIGAPVIQRFLQETLDDPGVTVEHPGGQIWAVKGRHATVLAASTWGTGRYLDAPWRPADVAQREGRIVRQGNLNPEIQIYRYVTQRSFDGYMWQPPEKSGLHRPGHAQPARRPRNRRRRRHRPVLQRSQGPRHRQPPPHGQSRSRRRPRQTPARRTRLPPQPGHPPPHHHPPPPGNHQTHPPGSRPRHRHHPAAGH